MQPLRARLRAILLRHPHTRAHPIPIRLFTSHTSRLTSLTRTTTRPALPFLYATHLRRTQRLISTETKDTLTYGVKLGLYWTLLFWTIAFSGAIGWWVLREDRLDRQHPSPPEWRYFVKHYWRNAMDELETEGQGRGMTDWTKVGTYLRTVVGLLEDYQFFVHRPSGCVLQDDVYDRTLPFAADESLRDPVPPTHDGKELWPARIGYDITMQSEEWRRGYFEAMLLTAKGAEMRDGYWTHILTKTAYAPQHVRSEENPFPLPLPPGATQELPDIADCTPTMEPPDFHYRRLLTTKGFSDAQRMRAGVAYASWLDHLGDTQGAEAMLQWSMGLATSKLEDRRADEIIDKKTGIIKAGAPFVTPNILTVAEAVARHRSSEGRIPESLSIYLSIIRARRKAPEAPPSRQYPPKKPDYSLNSVDSIIRWVTSLPFATEVPPAPPSGDETFERKRSDDCEEAGLALYVSEILFAKMGRRREALAWTRDATDTAEARYQDKALNLEGKKACEQCAHTGLQNWRDMLSLLAQEQGASRKSGDPENSARPIPSKGGNWFWRGLESVGISNDPERGLLDEQDWKAEEKQIQYRLAQFEEALLSTKLNAMIAGQSNWFAI